jgi:hypothetical protein
MLLLALPVSCDRGVPSKVQVDRKAEEAIRAEARAFYRDLGAQDTPALLNHFWPAKIAARWEPPFEPAPARPAPLAAGIVPGAQGSPALRCASGEVAVAQAEVRMVGSWARAMVPRCAGGEDEVWMLEFGGRWKIVRLALGGGG